MSDDQGTDAAHVEAAGAGASGRERVAGRHRAMAVVAALGQQDPGQRRLERGRRLGGLAPQLLARLEAEGPAVVDDYSAGDGRILQVGQPRERARAVRATIAASTSLLDPQEAERFLELGVFAEDETIPFGLIAQLWLTNGGLDDLAVGRAVRPTRRAGAGVRRRGRRERAGSARRDA